MGYCIQHKAGQFIMKPRHFKKSCIKINELIEEMGRLSFVREDEFKPTTSKKAIVSMWDSLRYDARILDNGDLEIFDFIGDKLGDDFEIFKAVAECMEDGFMDFVGEDGEAFIISIANGKLEIE